MKTNKVDVKNNCFVRIFSVIYLQLTENMLSGDIILTVLNPHSSSPDHNRQRALWVSLVQCFGPFRKRYVKLPSHLDGSQPQSTFSIGTKPGEQASASRHNHHALQHPLALLFWAFCLLWVTLQMHQSVKAGSWKSDIPTLLRELLLSESEGIVDKML